MLKIGDIVKVKGKTMVGDEEQEVFPIGTICRVVEVGNNDKKGVIVGIVPETEPYKGYGEYLYLACDVEKGHMEWVQDE